MRKLAFERRIDNLTSEAAEDGGWGREQEASECQCQQVDGC